ncbi:MAG: asparagine synthase (glutamine-hydrolyzing) [Bradymonadales bacterium]|nr:asparagine synthase (glutamine-hydrolyzing) [Bradymonadales bacterium]
MCGIAGVLLPTEEWVPEKQVTTMTETLRHRGPDGSGFYRNKGVALGHRRLNVIDIEGGAQPMSNEDDTIWVTYNGEIYNFQELRQQLESLGHRFRTRSDTEVLVHGYEQWGDDVVCHLVGMFAFALWDGRQRRALLARDRMGQKPLFYAHLQDGRLLFGSEAKAIVAHPDVPPAVNEEALAAYLTHEYLPGTLCMFAGLSKLLPGHRLVYQSGSIRIDRYWDIPFDEHPYQNAAQAEQAFLDAFDTSVRLRLIADVPLGVFLSGGIDSSAVAAIAIRHRPAETVQTFSIGFEDKSFDESHMARLVARSLGTCHHERLFGVDALLDTLPKVLDKLDEPFGDASLLPTYLLSAFTRESVTVALGGDGGDELWLGYPTFKAEAPARLYRRLPLGIRRLVERQAAGLSVSTRNFSFDFLVKSFLRAANQPEPLRHMLWLASAIPGSADDPLASPLRRRYPMETVLSFATDAFHSAPNRSTGLQRLSYQYARTYLAEDILTKVDRASMAVSLEARSPFLDHRVVEVIANMPAGMKLRGGLISKYLLKKAFLGALPFTVLTRKKKGFGIPIARWLKGPLRERMCDLLASGRLKRAGFLKPQVVDRLVEEHLRGRRDNRKMLWTLLSFEMWRDRYGLSNR